MNKRTVGRSVDETCNRDDSVDVPLAQTATHESHDQTNTHRFARALDTFESIQPDAHA
jgi:hypothetical protein